MVKSNIRSRLSFQDELEHASSMGINATKSLFDPSKVILNYNTLLSVVRDTLPLEYDQNLFRIFLFTYKFHGPGLFWKVNDKNTYKKRFGRLLKQLQVALLDDGGLHHLSVVKGRVTRLFKPNEAVYRALGIECEELKNINPVTKGKGKGEGSKGGKSDPNSSRKRVLSNRDVAVKVQRLL